MSMLSGPPMGQTPNERLNALSLPDRLRALVKRLEELRGMCSANFPSPPQALGPIEDAMLDAAKYIEHVDKGGTIALPRNPLTEAQLDWFDSHGHCDASCDWNQCYPQIADEVAAVLGVSREHIAERWNVGLASISSAAHDQFLAKYQQLRHCNDQGCVKCIDDVDGLLGAACITISG